MDWNNVDQIKDQWRSLVNTVLNLPGHVAQMGSKRKAYMILMRKQERKRPLGTPRRRWVDNIKIDFRKVGWNGMD
jgi:hypothetical protein